MAMDNSIVAAVGAHKTDNWIWHRCKYIPKILLHKDPAAQRVFRLCVCALKVVRHISVKRGLLLQRKRKSFTFETVPPASCTRRRASLLAGGRCATVERIRLDQHHLSNTHQMVQRIRGAIPLCVVGDNELLRYIDADFMCSMSPLSLCLWVAKLQTDLNQQKLGSCGWVMQEREET